MPCPSVYLRARCLGSALTTKHALHRIRGVNQSLSLCLGQFSGFHVSARLINERAKLITCTRYVSTVHAVDGRPKFRGQRISIALT